MQYKRSTLYSYNLVQTKLNQVNWIAIPESLMKMFPVFIGSCDAHGVVWTRLRICFLFTNTEVLSAPLNQ